MQQPFISSMSLVGHHEISKGGAQVQTTATAHVQCQQLQSS